MRDPHRSYVVLSESWIFLLYRDFRLTVQKKWRKRKRDMQVKPGEAGDEEEKEEGLAEAAKSELPFTICGSLLKSAGQRCGSLPYHHCPRCLRK